MIYKLKIFPKAKSDLSEISSWYEDIQKGLGKRFLKNVSLEMKVVKSNPISFQIRYDTTRVVLIKKFPYLIHYEIIDNEIDEIEELEEEDTLSLSNKKKKVQGLQYRILKKCKNINAINWRR